MSTGSFVNRFNELEKETYGIGISVQQKISNKDTADARVSTFYNLAQLIRSCKIYYILKEEYLQNRQWYVDTYLQKWQQQWPVSAIVGGKAAMIHNDHEILNNDFDQIMLIGYTQILFSVMESGFRLFVTALDPTACKQGADDFHIIYNWLLVQTNRKKQQYEELLKFFSAVRNTIHNNGVYRNKNKKYQNIPLTYRQKTYDFDHDKPVAYSNRFELVYFEITLDVIAMMKDIILDSEKILNIPSILDPHGTRFSKDTFWPILS